MASRRLGNLLRDLRDDPAVARELIDRMSDDLLVELAVAIREETARRAIESGDRDAVIVEGFELGFERDGLATRPWIRGPFVVCPGGLVARNRANHRCRFVSADGTWVWDSADLIHEEKRSSPGKEQGFRAVALLPVVEGMALDVVRGRMRSGQHSVEQVVSFEVRRAQLVEVSQREVDAHGPV